MSQELWAIELLSNGLIIVDQDVKETLVKAIRQWHNSGTPSVLEILDHEGNTHGFSTDAIVMWYDDPEAIDEILKAQAKPL